MIDAGGNVTDGGDFSADVGGPLNGANATAAAKLTATFANHRRQADVGFGKSAAIRGRVTDATGAPIAGAAVQVLDRELKAGRATRSARRRRPAPTAASASRPGAGAARSIRFEYRSRRFLAAANAATPCSCASPRARR